MIHNPCACFGYVILQNTYSKGNVYEVQTSSLSNTVLFITKGHFVLKDKKTGEILDEHFPGSFGSDWDDGVSEVVAMEDSESFCLTAKLNRGYIPETIPVVIQADETYYFEAGARFFLCQGTIEVNSSELVGPCQVGVKSAQSLKAKTDVYGLIIK
jgi:hypothetical protein